MRVAIGQVYVEPGISFPFSYRMQLWLGTELSNAAGSSEAFASRFGADFRLVIRISADAKTPDNVLKGPTTFKKDKSVEFTVFLPYDPILKAEGDSRRVCVEFLLSGIRRVFESTGIGVVELDRRAAAILKHLSSDATMLEKPWTLS